jgi:hypothetical protein
MSPSRKLLCMVYALLALLALVGTWSHNVVYLGGGFVEGNQKFWLDTLVTPASTSITVDLLVLGFAINLWMVLEARRIALGYVWLYVLAGALIAISVAFPVYMIQRERILARRGETAAPPALRVGDIAGLTVLGLASAAFALLTLPH